MRALVQRVAQAQVEVEGRMVVAIGRGMLVFLGIEDTDTPEDMAYVVRKLAGLRIFDDDQGVMNADIREAAGQCLLVSQFTLFASTRKGNRPSYSRASTAQKALPVYQQTVGMLEEVLQQPVATGIFGADMQVSLINDGPVTILLDSKSRE